MKREQKWMRRKRVLMKKFLNVVNDIKKKRKENENEK